MASPYVFPGSTPFVVEAALELGVAVEASVVQKIPSFKTITLLASQVGTHPDPKVLLDAAEQHLNALKVAQLAAEKLIALVRGETDPKTPSKGKSVK